MVISDSIRSKFWKVTLFELTLRNQSPIFIFLFFIASPSGMNPATITLTLSENAPGVIPKYASHKVALRPSLCLLSGSIHNVTSRISPAWLSQTVTSINVHETNFIYCHYLSHVKLQLNLILSVCVLKSFTFNFPKH